MTQIRPQLVRPFDEENQRIGQWSYKYEINGKDYIVPATVGTLDELEERHNEEQKIIYWRSGEFKKYMDLGLEFQKNKSGLAAFIPCPVLQLRMIEEGDNFANGKVYEVLKLFLDKENKTLNMVQFLYEESRPDESNQWDESEHGVYEWQWFARMDLHTGKCGLKTLRNFPHNIDRLGDDYPWEELELVKIADILGDTKDITEDEKGSIHRAYILFCGFNFHLMQMKPEEAKYNTGRSNTPSEMSIFERYELAQEDMRNSVQIIQKGKTKTRSTGTGTKHSHRYLVRGHERVIGGKKTWVKPHVRGEGEFVAKNLGTDASVKKIVETHGFWRSMKTVRRSAGGLFRRLRTAANWIRRVLHIWS